MHTSNGFRLSDEIRERLIGRYPIADRSDHPGLFSGRTLVRRALDTFPAALLPGEISPKALDEAGKALAAHILKSIENGDSA